MISKGPDKREIHGVKAMNTRDKTQCRFDAERLGGRVGGRKSWQKKISTSALAPCVLHTSLDYTENLVDRYLKDCQYVFDFLIFAIIAAQCGNNCQRRTVNVSLELDCCHERLHFTACDKFLLYVSPDTMIKSNNFEMHSAGEGEIFDEILN